MAFSLTAVGTLKGVKPEVIWSYFTFLKNHLGDLQKAKMDTEPLGNAIMVIQTEDNSEEPLWWSVAKTALSQCKGQAQPLVGELDSTCHN